MTIGGEPTDAASGETFLSEDPFTGLPWAEIPRAGAVDVDRAVTAASAAFADWKRTKPQERARLMLRLADLVEENADRLATIEVRDNGKLFTEMAGQARYIAGWYRYYAGAADKIQGAVIPTDKSDVINFTREEPLGVVGMIVPWNSPLLLLTWKLAPALATGNVAVIKPSEFTSASTLAFMELIAAAGFPPGVVNVVTGYGSDVGAALVSHPGVSKIAFTGSDDTGARIYAAAAEGIKHVCLELGGKSPNIVFDDADEEAAIAGVISGILAASGQTCIAGSRLLLQQGIHDRFLERLVERVSKARLGDPMQIETNVGPVATRPQFQKVLDYIEVARTDGAACRYGGKRYEGPGAAGEQFVEPTIFAGVNNEMRIAREEVFGPVLAVIPFRDDADAYAIANDSAYGLGAGVWTRDLARAINASQEIEAGTVWVNTYRALSYTSPFGGYKRSGIGREGGFEAMREYTQTKSVWICTNPSVDDPFVMR
ncbi:MAG: aldehyde dehydrogenase [Pseudomonadota bacterium]